jgi:hypothetical protein
LLRRDECRDAGSCGRGGSSDRRWRGHHTSRHQNLLDQQRCGSRSEWTRQYVRRWRTHTTCAAIRYVANTHRHTPTYANQHRRAVSDADARGGRDADGNGDADEQSHEHANAYAKSYTHPNPNAHAHSNADAHANADTDADPHADADSNAYAYAVASVR